MIFFIGHKYKNMSNNVRDDIIQNADNILQNITISDALTKDKCTQYSDYLNIDTSELKNIYSLTQFMKYRLEHKDSYVNVNEEL